MDQSIPPPSDLQPEAIQMVIDLKDGEDIGIVAGDAVKVDEGDAVKVTLAPDDVQTLTQICTEYQEIKDQHEISSLARYQGIKQATVGVVCAIVVLEVVGVTYFMMVGGYTLSEALLFSHYTMTSAGYGNYPIPKTPQYQSFLIFYMFAGMACVTLLVAQVYQYFSMEASMMKHYHESEVMTRQGPYMVSWEGAEASDKEGAQQKRTKPPPSCMYSMYTCLNSVRNKFGGGRCGTILFVVSTLLGLLLVGTFVMMWLEGVTFMQGFYFATFTMTTVGYGDIAPTKPSSTWFCVFWLPFDVAFLSIYWGNVVNMYAWVADWSIRRNTRDIQNEVNGLRAEEAKKREEVESCLDDKSGADKAGAVQVAPVLIRRLSRPYSASFRSGAPATVPEDARVVVSQAECVSSSNIKTMKDVIDFVRGNLGGRVDSYLRTSDSNLTETFLTIRSTSGSSMPFHENGARIPSFVLLILVQERMAEIIAHDIAGYQSCSVRTKQMEMTIEGLAETIAHWCIPRGARNAFVAAAFESLLFVGEKALVTKGADALFQLSPFDFHELMSPLLAALGDAGTMEGWLARTEALAAKEFHGEMLDENANVLAVSKEAELPV